MHSGTELFDPRTLNLPPGSAVKITEVAADYLMVEIVEPDGEYSVRRIPRRAVGHA